MCVSVRVRMCVCVFVFALQKLMLMEIQGVFGSRVKSQRFSLSGGAVTF